MPDLAVKTDYTTPAEPVFASKLHPMTFIAGQIGQQVLDDLKTSMKISLFDFPTELGQVDLLMTRKVAEHIVRDGPTTNGLMRGITVIVRMRRQFGWEGGGWESGVTISLNELREDEMRTRHGIKGMFQLPTNTERALVSGRDRVPASRHDPLSYSSAERANYRLFVNLSRILGKTAFEEVLLGKEAEALSAAGDAAAKAGRGVTQERVDRGEMSVEEATRRDGELKSDYAMTAQKVKGALILLLGGLHPLVVASVSPACLRSLAWTPPPRGARDATKQLQRLEGAALKAIDANTTKPNAKCAAHRCLAATCFQCNQPCTSPQQRGWPFQGAVQFLHRGDDGGNECRTAQCDGNFLLGRVAGRHLLLSSLRRDPQSFSLRRQAVPPALPLPRLQQDVHKVSFKRPASTWPLPRVPRHRGDTCRGRRPDL